MSLWGHRKWCGSQCGVKRGSWKRAKGETRQERQEEGEEGRDGGRGGAEAAARAGGRGRPGRERRRRGLADSPPRLPLPVPLPWLSGLGPPWPRKPPPRRLPTSLTRTLLAFAASPRRPPQREARHWPLGPLQIAVLPAAPRSHTVLPFLPRPLRPAPAFSAPGLLQAPTDPLLFSLHVQSLRVRDLSTSCTPSPW